MIERSRVYVPRTRCAWPRTSPRVPWPVSVTSRVPRGLEALDRGEAHTSGGDRQLIGADRAPVEPDLAGGFHGSGSEAGLELLHAQTRG